MRRKVSQIGPHSNRSIVHDVKLPSMLSSDEFDNTKSWSKQNRFSPVHRYETWEKIKWNETINIAGLRARRNPKIARKDVLNLNPIQFQFPLSLRPDLGRLKLKEIYELVASMHSSMEW